jgi:hypothetical protein
MNKNKMKYGRKFLTGFLIIIIAIGSNLLVRKTDIGDLKLFETVSLFAYFGVLIGFALTIYTFGLSMVTDIKKELRSNTNFSEEKIEELLIKLANGFAEIKGDIWLIFWSIILILVFSVANIIENPFGWDLKEWEIPQTASVSLFIISTYSMYDIMKTLFNLSEIKLLLLKKGKG